MIHLNFIKKYFTYDDRLRSIVSVITGILILIVNAISGFVVIRVFFELIFGFVELSPQILFLFIVSGIVIGVGILGLCILLIELMLNGIEIENYSYLRLVLLVSVVIYLLVLISYLLFSISEIIQRHIIPVFSR